MSLKIISFGESLFDLYASENENENIELSAFSGGAPMNFICASKKFGADECIFYTNITSSSFSKKIKDVLSKFSVLVRTRRTPSEPPAAIVMENGDFNFLINAESFKFSRWAFRRKDFKGANLFHCGLLFLSTIEGFRATLSAIRLAKRKGAKISFDINYRPAILKLLSVSERRYKRRFMKILKYIDFLKLNEDEADIFFGTSRTQKLFKKFSSRANKNKIFVLTRGIKGSDVFYKGQVYSHAAYKVAKIIDPTGAGDIFFAGFLTKLLLKKEKNFELDDIKYALEFANKVAAKSTEYKGSITALDHIND
jgi:sugar/nucleoside kinase (ribokinase family)